MHRMKKGQIPYITGRADQFATSAKLLNIIHKSYGFSADIIETINQEYQCGKAGFSGGNYRPHCYVYRLTVVVFLNAQFYFPWQKLTTARLMYVQYKFLNHLL